MSSQQNPAQDIVLKTIAGASDTEVVGPDVPGQQLSHTGKVTTWSVRAQVAGPGYHKEGCARARLQAHVKHQSSSTHGLHAGVRGPAFATPRPAQSRSVHEASQRQTVPAAGRRGLRN